MPINTVKLLLELFDQKRWRKVSAMKTMMLLLSIAATLVCQVHAVAETTFQQMDSTMGLLLVDRNTYAIDLSTGKRKHIGAADVVGTSSSANLIILSRKTDDGSELEVRQSKAPFE